MLQMDTRRSKTSRRPPRTRRLLFKEWREHFGFTQEEIAARMETDKGTVSRLESGRQRGTFEWAERYATALKINPTAFYRLPTEPSLDEMVADLPPEQRELIIRMIESAVANDNRRPQ